jgi:predicted O-methyltransferase YrrM
MLKYFLKFLLVSKDKHSLHSPFVFDLYTKIIKDSKTHKIFAEIENLRKKLLKNKTVIEITDFGAGSKIYKNNFREIRQIAKSAEKAPRFGRLIFRLIQHFKPAIIFDLGTSLGVTTLYESKAHEEGKVFTFEGCPETAKIAEENFRVLNCKNIEMVVGNLDETLSNKLSEITQLDFAFFDANHRYEPTVRYFEMCKEKATEETVFMFDDIHWSDEMHEAWQYISKHPDVMISIDLFFMGLVFFRKNQPKQHFILRYF